MSLSREFDYLDELKQLESELVRNGKEKCSVEDLAKAVGRTVFSIYKSSSPTEDAIFGLEWLPLFMALKENWDILDFLNKKANCLPPVKVPKLNSLKRDEKEFYKDLHEILNETSLVMYEFINDSENREKLKKLQTLIRKSIKELLTVEKFAEKLHKAQFEMEL